MAKKVQQESTPVPTGHARKWTPEQRRAAFLAARKAEPENYQVLEADFKETLVPYNHIVLDDVLGLQGIARHGTVTQVHGDEGAGKSSSALCMAAAYQQATGEPVAIFDYEGSSSPAFARNCGIDPNLLYFEQPTSVQDSIKKHIALMEDAGVRLFVNDSIPFMDAKIERKDINSGKAFKANYGNHAKSMSNFYRMTRSWRMEYDVALLMINQTRARIDDSTEAQWATKHSYTNRVYTLPGGYMCRFAPSVMLELTLEKALAPKEIADIKPEELFINDIAPTGTGKGANPTVNLVRARTLKNKPTGAGFRKGDIFIRPGRGWDEWVSVLQLARSLSFITNSGAKWFVGATKEDAFATYPNKTAALEALVINRDVEVLSKLRSLVKDTIKDNSSLFAAEVSNEEIEFLDEGKAKTFNIEDDDEIA